MRASVRRMERFFRDVLESVRESRIPYLVGGGYAFERHTGFERDPHDLDLFVRRDDARRLLDHFAARGYRTRMTHPHWLGKIHHNGSFVDVIFSSGNGLVRVDDEWFEHARVATCFGHRVRLVPIEEMIWSKAFVMERERFDGADVLHLIRAARRLDWERLIRRFGPFWRVLLAHLVLFEFVYPNDRDKIPRQVMRHLTARLSAREAKRPEVCLGPLLSRAQYLSDVGNGAEDGRLIHGAMLPEEIAHWTAAAKLGGKPRTGPAQPARRKRIGAGA